MSAQRIFAWLENSRLAAAIAESSVLFPFIEAIHVLAAAFLVGSIAIVDLRLLGLLGRAQKPLRLLSDMLPLTWVAFTMAAISGTLLFSVQAVHYAADFAFRLKLVLIALAGLNMLLFQLVTGRKISGRPDDAVLPASARIAAGLSLTLWSGVIFSARWIYFAVLG